MNSAPRTHAISHRAGQLRQAFTSSVQANELRLDEDWGSSCCAYNVYIPLSAQTKNELTRVQELLFKQEPALLRVPRTAMHISVAWLLPVHHDFAITKEEMWVANKQLWQLAMSTTFAEIGEFEVSFNAVIATDAAVIALAEPTGTVNRIRQMLAETLAVPWEICRGDLVHTTLFRYAEPLNRPKDFLTRVANIKLTNKVRVKKLLLVREYRFPSLEFEVLESYCL